MPCLLPKLLYRLDRSRPVRRLGQRHHCGTRIAWAEVAILDAPNSDGLTQRSGWLREHFAEPELDIVSAGHPAMLGDRCDCAQREFRAFGRSDPGKPHRPSALLGHPKGGQRVRRYSCHWALGSFSSRNVLRPHRQGGRAAVRRPLVRSVDATAIEARRARSTGGCPAAPSGLVRRSRARPIRGEIRTSTDASHECCLPHYRSNTGKREGERKCDLTVLRRAL